MKINSYCRFNEAYRALGLLMFKFPASLMEYLAKHPDIAAEGPSRPADVRANLEGIQQDARDTHKMLSEAAKPTPAKAVTMTLELIDDVLKEVGKHKYSQPPALTFLGQLHQRRNNLLRMQETAKARPTVANVAVETAAA